jgi:hypothetical protein
MTPLAVLLSDRIDRGLYADAADFGKDENGIGVVGSPVDFGVVRPQGALDL